MIKVKSYEVKSENTVVINRQKIKRVKPYKFSPIQEETEPNEVYDSLNKHSKILFGAGLTLVILALIVGVIVSIIFYEFLFMFWVLPFIYIGVFLLVASLLKSLRIKRNTPKETARQKRRRNANWFFQIIFALSCLGGNLVIFFISNLIIKKNEKGEK